MKCWLEGYFQGKIPFKSSRVLVKVRSPRDGSFEVSGKEITYLQFWGIIPFCGLTTKEWGRQPYGWEEKGAVVQK